MAEHEDTTFEQNLQWARVLVNSDSRLALALLNVVVGLSLYTIQLWCEIQVPNTGCRENGGGRRWCVLSTC